MVELMTMYTLNSFSADLDLSKYYYDEFKFIEIINRCKNGGMILHLIENGMVRNASDNLYNYLKELCIINRQKEELYEKQLNEILLDLRTKGIKCIIGGAYVISKDYCSRGDIYLDEIVLYLNKDYSINIDAHNELEVNVIIKDESFFEEYYNECLRYNILPIHLLYEEFKSRIKNSNALDNNMIMLYILHQLYLDNRTVRERNISYDIHRKIINSIFSVSV